MCLLLIKVAAQQKRRDSTIRINLSDDDALAPLVPENKGKVQIDPKDMPASLVPEDNIPDEDKLAPLVHRQ